MKKTLIASICFFVTLGVSATPDLNNPMTKAVLEVYEKQLKENPEDYHIWLNRANEYYRNNEYMRALNDVDNALKYCPTKESADRIMALMLRANIYIQTDRLQKALEDLNSVLALDNENYVALYQRANTQYTLGNYTLAKQDYQRLFRMNSRSPEALVGLARVAVKENNLGQANEYLDQAIANDPNNSELYVRRATVRRDMANHQSAVEDLILSLAVNAKNNRAMGMLVEYGNVNYPVVVAGLTNAMTQAPNVSMYPYLRAVIAQHHYHYKAALNDYQLIIDKNLEEYQGIWRSMAECLFAMGRFEEALKDVDHALALDRNAGEAALLRTKILRAMGKYDEAKKQAAQAVAMLTGKVRPLNEMGLVYINLKDYKQASELFAETTMMAPEGVEAQKCYMLRAWVLGTYLNQPVAASGFYKTVSEIASDFNSNSTAQFYGAFARAYNGEESEAIAIADDILANNADQPYVLYLGACFYAQLGNFDKGIEYTEKALECGYANYYDWAYENDARVNVAPLRDDLRFLNLMERYKHLWN